MSETSKTVAFIITASILGVAAFSSHWMTKPADVVGFEKVGEEFFPDFQDATSAKSLEVTAYDVGSDGLREFSVEFKDGLWRIPSHHGYPAEAAERLARTATSLIGLERESIVARRNSKHEKYGVVDPGEPEVDPETVGQRITLRDESGEIVADYIIGKPAGSVAEDSTKMVRELQKQDDYYYVRVPNEKETYKAKIQIDLSTRFSDWINPDLLKLESSDINRLEIDNYELVEQDVPVGNNRMQTQISRNVIDRQKLTRDGFSPWQLEGLNDQTEELNTLQIEQIITLLDSMKIVGVRPKLKLNGELLVNSDLSINEALARKDPQLFQRRVYQLQQDLERKGFTIGATEEDPTKIALLASRGELKAATKNGVLYTLYFGRSVSGDVSDIEIGAAISTEEGESEEDSEEKSASEPESAAEQDPKTEAVAAAGEDDEEASGENRSRYVAIRVDFDPTALGDVPVKPVEPAEPAKPEGYDEWKAAKEKMLQDAAKGEAEDPVDSAGEGDAAAESDKPAEDQDPPTPPADIESANDEEFQKYEQAMEDYEKAEIQFSTDLEIYETNLAAYQAREKSGKELVEELNERFAEWFYVVPAESLATLKLTRADLVNVKETTPPEANSPLSPADATLPAAPDINYPGKAEKASGKDTESSGEQGGSEAGSVDDASADKEDGL